MRRWIAFAGSIVVASALLSAGPAYPVDVCSMLTPAEAASALGVPEVNAGAGANRCIWTPKKYQRGAGTLTVTIEGARDAAKMMNMGTPVNLVGDEAIQTVVPSTKSSVLHVRKGTTWFVVSVTTVPLDQAEKVQQTVAQAIASRM